MSGAFSKTLYLILVSAALHGAAAGALPILGEYVPEGPDTPAGVCKIVFYHGSYYDPIQQNWDKLCSGTIISKRRLLTAAHCVNYLAHHEALSAKIICSPGSFAWGQDVTVITKHPDYVEKDTEPIPNHDVAILEVGKDFDFPPITLAQSKDAVDEALKTPEQCVLYGYGKDNDGKEGNLHGAQLQILPYNPALFRRYGPHVFFSGFNGRNRAEVGDSGGPVLCKNADGAWIEIAVHVQADERWNISLHERVDNNLDWIRLIQNLPRLPREPESKAYLFADYVP